MDADQMLKRFWMGSEESEETVGTSANKPMFNLNGNQLIFASANGGVTYDEDLNSKSLNLVYFLAQT